MIFLLVLVLFVTGLFVYFKINNEPNILEVLIYPLLIGIVINSLIFLILCFFNIYYSLILFIIFNVIIILLSIFIKKSKIKTKFNINRIPIYCLLFILYFIIKCVLINNSSSISWYNWDELSTYSYISKIIYLTHDMSYALNSFYKVNYFLGVMTNNFYGEAILVEVRIFQSIFYVILALFIYKELWNNKVNRHIAGLLAMIFLISSGEIIYAYLSFYNNAFFSCFCVLGIYLLLKYLFVDHDKRNLILSIIMLSGMCLSRREGYIILLVFLAFLFIYTFVKKKDYKKISCMFTIPLFIFIANKISSLISSSTSSTTSSTTSTITSIVNQIITRLQPEKISSYLSSIYSQMFEPNEWYSNYLITGVGILSIVVLIFKKNKTKDIKCVGFWIILFQFLYLCLVIVTNFISFTEREFLKAASFSRYILMILPFSFILLGILLFKDTNKTKKHDIEEEVQHER